MQFNKKMNIKGGLDLFASSFALGLAVQADPNKSDLNGHNHFKFF